MIKTLLAAGAIAVLSTSASAVTFTDTKPAASPGVANTFTFSPAPANLGLGGALDIEVRGDFSAGALNETAELTFDGVSGSVVIGSSSLSGSITGLSFLSRTNVLDNGNENQFITSFSVSNGLLDQIVAGGSIGITLDNAVGVNLFFDNAFHRVSLTYNEAAVVPLPAGLPLLAVGLAALGILRRRTA